MRFLGNVLATLVGLFIFFAVSSFFFIMILVAAGSEEEVKISDNSILHLNLNQPIVERERDNPFEELELFANTGTIGLIELVQTIQNAQIDDAISGIYLEGGFGPGGLASIEEIRDALQDFRNSGKFIVAYGEIYTETGYYLSSVADEVLLQPEGYFEFNGLSTSVTFMKGTFDKLGIEPEIFRVGDFKSAVEPFLREDMSEASRLQTESFLSSMYRHMVQNIATSRSMAPERVKEISDQMEARNPEKAFELGLVTGLKYKDEVLEILAEKTGADDIEDLSFVKLSDYQESFASSGYSKNRVAVVVANGDITGGNGDEETIGSEKISKEIRKLRLDDRVKAIVIRVNSPGGSALASDVIWREIKLAKEVKPVIASMSDVAASGGYYISMAADKIVASPTTVTGSIGIFSILFNAEDFFKEKLGITFDNVKTGVYSDILTINRPLNEVERQILQQQINEGYENFTGKAAEGRGMDIETLKEVASGRVWSGIEAKNNGLVDELGGLQTAIDIAAEMAELDDYSVRYYPKQKDFYEMLFDTFGASARTKSLQENLGDFYPYFETIKDLSKYQGIQARLPYNYKFH